MRHQVRKKRLDRTSSHRIAMFRNMVTSLIEVERITTTLTKAKMLRSIAEKMVTLAKNGTLHARRQAASVVRTPQAVQKLFSELGPRFKDRKGGYTRVLKLGFRHGDGAPMALIEYLGYQSGAAAPLRTQEEKKKKVPGKKSAKPKKAKAASEAKAEAKEPVTAKTAKAGKAPKKVKKKEKE